VFDKDGNGLAPLEDVQDAVTTIVATNRDQSTKFTSDEITEMLLETA